MMLGEMVVGKGAVVLAIRAQKGPQLLILIHTFDSHDSYDSQ